MIASLVMSFVSAVASGSAQKRQANAQAAIAQRQADTQRLQGEMRADEIRRRAEVIQGQQNALFGGSGVDLTGSVTDVLSNTAAGAQMDIYNTKFFGEQNALNLEASAANMRKAGSEAMTGSLLNFGAKAFSTVGMGMAGGAGAGMDSNLTGGTSGDWYRPNAFSTNVDGQGWE